MRGRWLQAAGVAAVALLVGVGAWYGSKPRPATAPSPVASHQGAKLYVASTFGDEVQVLDLASFALLARIPTGRLPRGLAVSGRKVYVAEAGAQSVMAIDAQTDRVVARHVVGNVPPHPHADMKKVRAAASCAECHAHVVVGTEPGTPALGPDGKLYLAETLGGELSQVDRASLVPARTIGIATGAPMAVAFHPVSHDGYVVSRTLGGSRTAASGLSAVPWLDPASEGTSWLTVYDPAFQVVRWRVELPGPGAHAAAFSRDGRELYVSLRGADKLAVVDTASRTVSRKLETGAGPAGVLPLADGSLAVACFNAHPGRVQVLDARTGAARKTIEVPDSPVDLAVVEGKLYVAAAGANEVAEVDLNKGEVTRHFKAGAAPVAVAVVP